MISWADAAKLELAAGCGVDIRPRGSSMRGLVEDGQLVRLEPCDPTSLQVGAVVLVHVGGRDYLHLLKERRDRQFLIGNNRGGVNGWVGPEAIFGVACLPPA